jgi:asparagine synthase (glutamine-hydrolysing)
MIFDRVWQSDERIHIEKVLANRRFSSHFVNCDQATPVDDFDAVLRFQDEPFSAPNLFLARKAWNSANENGVRVLLDGLLGDNTVSHGVEHLNDLARRWRWIALTRELRQLLDNSVSDVPLWKLLGAYWVREGIGSRFPAKPLANWMKRFNTARASMSKQRGVLAAEYCDRTNWDEGLPNGSGPRGRFSSSRQAHCDALNCGMIETALEVYNKGCSEFGLETRFPFADKRLVEFCLAIPGNQKVGSGYTRIVARRAMKGILPEEVRWRADKGDLGWSFISGFRLGQNCITSAIQSSERFLGRFLDLSRIDYLVSACAGRELVGEEVATLYLLAVLGMWGIKVFPS